MKSKKGFTLIELLVVISIVSLLSTIVIASLGTARDKARMASGKLLASRLFQTYGADAGIILNFESSVAPFTTEDSGDNNPVTPGIGAQFLPANWVTDTPTGQGHSLSFNGSTQYIRVSPGLVTSALSNATDEGKNFTFATWFKPSSASTVNGYIFSRQGAHEGILQSNGAFCFVIWYPVGAVPAHAGVNCNPKKYEVNKWYHLALSVDTVNNKASLYVDGQKVVEVNLTNSVRDYANSDFLVGGATGYLANGLIDDVRFYTSAVN